MLLATLACLSGTAALAATPGFVEDFDAGIGGFTQSFGHDVLPIASGGVDNGPYMLISSGFLTNLGAYWPNGPFAGNLPMDGVTGLSLFLSTTDPSLELHIGIGVEFENTWQSPPLVPPATGAWTKFELDFTSSVGWTQIVGTTGTFEQALATNNILLIRHDLAPYVEAPDQAASSYGVDRITILPAPAPPSTLMAGAACLTLGLLVYFRRA